VPALRLPVEQRRERLAALLEALAALRGGAKHAAHYGDRTPAWLLLVPMKGGINPFGRVVSADRSATRIDVDVLLAEFDAWADEVDGPALIGWAPGYLPDQRAEAEQRLARLLADGRMVIGHPRHVLRDTADQLRKGTLDRWLSDPLPALP
jgi:CRISPR-associated protein Cst2